MAKEKNELPETIKCSMCSTTMEFKEDGLWHRKYLCPKISCKMVIGLPFLKYDDDTGVGDFGSGEYKGEYKQND